MYTANSILAFTPQQSKQIADLLNHANGLQLNVSFSLRPLPAAAPLPAADFQHIGGPQRDARLPMPAPGALNGPPGMNIGLGLPSGFSRGGLGNGVQLPIHQHAPSMPMPLPSMSGQQFLQMPMQSPQMGPPLFTPRQDFRSISADYAFRGPPGIPYPPHMNHMGPTRYEAIAREFGMDMQTVERLAQRLAL
jgi:hypothetical protein